jgi:hypothetical protein
MPAREGSVRATFSAGLPDELTQAASDFVTGACFRAWISRQTAASAPLPSDQGSTDSF